VVVASSIGGLTAEMFARRYPERVAGLLFLDAASSGGLSRASDWFTTLKTAACAAAASARFGVIRLVDPFGLGRETSDGARRSAAVTYGPKPWGTICAMGRGATETVRLLNEAPPWPREVPLVVLSASSEEEMFPGYGWLSPELRASRIAVHQELAKRSDRGKWALVPNSTHLIGGSQPDVVADTVLKLLEEIDGPS
jgi:pimeloyl-ACP methyl ester carboxylesterase